MGREYEYRWSWSLPTPPEALWSLDVTVRGLEERLRGWRVAFGNAPPETQEHDAS